jgi:glycosyltransferase involved in cell wall biosynthesis
MSRWRIAHFVHRYPPALGGSEAYFERLSRFFAEQGHAVSVFTTNAKDLGAFWSSRQEVFPAAAGFQDNVWVQRYPLWHFPARRLVLKSLGLFPAASWQRMMLSCNPISLRMWQEAGRPHHRFNIVHAAAFPYAWPIACGLRLARRLKIPFVVTPFLHLGDPDDPFDRTRLAYTSRPLLSLLRQADRVFVQTPSERDILLSVGLREDSVVLQGLGIDSADCAGGNRERARLAWHCRHSEVVIGHLANNSEEKGTCDLLRAIDLLKRSGSETTVVLAGPEMPNFRRFWRTFKAKQNVIRLGVLDAEQKRDFFAGIDVFALPSRSDSFGLVLLEAWANRIPNVAYRAGGIADLIHHDQDGLLVPCGDVQKLAKALGELLFDGAKRRRLGEAGNRRLPHEFDWVGKLRCVQEIYRELIGRQTSEKVGRPMVSFGSG